MSDIQNDTNNNGVEEAKPKSQTISEVNDLANQNKSKSSIKFNLSKFFVVNRPKKEIVADVQRLNVNPTNFSGQGNPFKNSLTMPTSGKASPTKSTTTSSQQSGPRTANATGSGRNKVMLKPGHSLMDWIRLTSSGKDFTCGSQGMARVTGLELQKHNQRNDAWTAINGVVYNISAYMDFHPGGVQELERAAGHDSTDLFNQIHPWVNFESMLQKCCVGRLVRDENVLKAKLDAAEVSEKERKKTINKKESITSVSRSSLPTFADVQTSISHPTYRWSDEKDAIRLVVNVKLGQCFPPSFLVQVMDDQQLKVTFKLLQKLVYRVHLRLHDKIQPDELEIKFIHNEMEFHLPKLVMKSWPCLGKNLSFDNSLLNETEMERTFLKCRLIERHPLTHDTQLFVLELPPISLLRMRTCEHVQLRIPDTNSTTTSDADTLSPTTTSFITRYYTPVPNELHTLCQHQPLANNQIHLAIKLYSNGQMSQLLNSIQTEWIEVSEPISLDVDVDSILSSRHKFYLIAAGTGITPMMSLIYKLKESTTETTSSVRLLYFNKSIRDIIYQDKLIELESDRLNGFNFELVNVLSEVGDQSWSGKRGRISQELLREQIRDDIDKEMDDSFIFVCGPNGFVVSTVNFLQELDLNRPSLLHVFTE